MSNPAVLRMVDAVTVPVPDIDQGLEFYRDHLGHELLWRNDEVGQAGLRLPENRARAQHQPAVRPQLASHFGR
jgi:catechol 2,3-dioxygenase-like lactoylglutathione lyase family enzyme